MKQLLAFILLLSFAAQTFGQAFIVAGYYINTGAFAKNCENKDKPELKCRGKCQMMKKLKQEEKKDQQDPQRKSNYKNITISSKSFFAVTGAVFSTLTIFRPAANTGVTIDRSSDIFHPPQTAGGNDPLL